MSLRSLIRLVVLGLVGMILVSMVSAVTAGNTVPRTRLSDSRFPINANVLKPPECAALNLTAIVVCPSAGGNCDGTDANDLILGSAFADTISGGKGADCILGGGGDDYMKAGPGNSVCIGGPGTDSFHPSCKTQIQ